MPVYFFCKDIQFKLPYPGKTSKWIKDVLKKEKKNLSFINYIFCSDKFLLKLNKKYRQHDTLTDILTFDYTDNKSMKSLKSDIFISIERVRENAEKFKTSFDTELHRVLIHGVLHLVGFDDKKKIEKELMHKKEDAYLSLRK